MIGYSSGMVANGLKNTLIPFGSGNHFNGTTNYLNFFYQFPGKWSDGLQQVFGISENGISILVSIFLVVIILTVLFHFTTTHHN